MHIPATILTSLCLPVLVAAAGQSEIKGVLKDVDRGTAIWGAHLSLQPGEQRAVSDKQGGFTLPCRPGRRYRLQVELAGYEKASVAVSCPDSAAEIWLIPSEKTTEREEIVITGKREKRPAKKHGNLPL